MDPVIKARFDKWVRILNENDSEMSKIATEKLAAMGEMDAVPHLIKAMENRAFSVSLAATRALGKLGDKQAVPALMRTMKTHAEVMVQTAAAEALGLIGDESAVTGLKQVIDDYLATNRNRYDRVHSFKRGLFMAAIRSLRQIGTREANKIASNAESVDTM